MRLCQTDPSVRSVQLIGSWDHFSSCYTMKPDPRRGRGQWRGCYSFNDIVCDDKAVNGLRRNGGLKMGATYYYYYEIDGATETYNSAEPSTTACPFLPGQTVNALSVPVERTPRLRSASLTSLRHESFRTMNPDAKFTTPRPAHAPMLTLTASLRRLGSASSLLNLNQDPSARAPSPGPRWKRLFTRKPPTHHPAAPDQDTVELPTPPSPPRQPPASTASRGRRARDISHESLRRFLSEEPPARSERSPAREPTVAEPMPMPVPDDVVEEADDDDNFATSATSDHQFYATSLSPPPFQRSASSIALSLSGTDAKKCFVPVKTHPSNQHGLGADTAVPAPPSGGPALPSLDTDFRPRWSISAPSTALTTPVSPALVDEECPPPFGDSNDEDEVLSSHDDDNFSSGPVPSHGSPREAFPGYRLPTQGGEEKKASHSRPSTSAFNAAQLLSGGHAGIAVDGENFLGAPIDTGLDDFANELGWIADAIRRKQNH
ncbi:hypothetical protein RJ55_01189 [Drechmeria coniospora]|nr:hypothetical protein RJ55_01189 [Drechmeria coniospora]